MKTIMPCLWFDSNAEEAVNYYVDIFPDSEILKVTRNPPGMPQPEGSVLTISFKLRGEEFLALNGGPMFTFNEAISLYINCKDQEEIDYYWEKLVDGGSEMACGWLKDKYGVAWQIVPDQFMQWIDADDMKASERVLTVMQTMVKFDYAKLEAAYNDNQ